MFRLPSLRRIKQSRALGGGKEQVENPKQEQAKQKTNTMRYNSKLNFLTAITSLMLFSCSSGENTEGNEIPVTVSDNLHMAFKTPDWERNIDCSLLDLYPTVYNDSTYGVSATSASTKETFCLTYPKYSSKIVNSKYLKKHKIMSIYDNNAPFQFSQKLPLNQNSLDDLSKKLVSSEGFSATEYNQVEEIKYIASDGIYDIFRVKCKYEMKMYLPTTPDIIKPVSGTFAFKIRTLKD